MRWRALVAVSCAVASAAVGQPAAVVAAPELRVCVVIPDGVEEGAALPLRLADRLAAALRAAGERAAVRVVAASSSEAAAGLQRRLCDAVVVLGADRPRALREVAGRTFAATLSRDFAFRPAYLFLPEGDDAAAERLAGSFGVAVRALTFPAKDAAGQ